MLIDLNDHQRMQISLALQQQVIGAQMILATLNPAPAPAPEQPDVGTSPSAPAS